MHRRGPRLCGLGEDAGRIQGVQHARGALHDPWGTESGPPAANGQLHKTPGDNAERATRASRGQGGPPQCVKDGVAERGGARRQNLGGEGA